MVQQPSVGWYALLDALKAHYYSLNDEVVKQKLNTFLHYKEMFKPGVPILGMLLDLGITSLTGRYEVVMSIDVSQNFINYVEATMAAGPVPALETLVKPMSYEIVASFEVNNSNVVKNTLDKAKKKNKQKERLRKAKREAELAKRLVNSNQYVFFSIDIESYEMNHSILLEIGWSMYDGKTNRFLDQHYINEDYRHLKNGQFVDDEKENFSFGTSVWCSLKQAFKELRKDLDWAVQRDGGFVLVGHGFDSDLKYLQQQKFLWPRPYGGETLDVAQSANIAILNTDTIYAASINDLHNPPSLGTLLHSYNVDTWHLHNAGNDAHYTLQLLMILVSKEF